MPRIWNVAHRGASAERPENTVPAAELAISQGADVVEADVRLTADGIPVAMHDATVDRTTSGTGLLREMTLAEVRALDCGHGAGVPTLEEILTVCRGHVRVNVDVKEPDAALPALAAVASADMLAHATVISFLPEVCDLVSDESPETPVMHLVDSAAGLAGLGFGSAGSRTLAAGVGVPHALVTEPVVERLHRAGAGVFAWTVDDEPEMLRLIACGVNGVVTNRPGLLARVLQRKHMTNR